MIETSRAININKNTIASYEKRRNEIKDSNKYLDKKEVTYPQNTIKKSMKTKQTQLKSDLWIVESNTSKKAKNRPNSF